MDRVRLKWVTKEFTLAFPAPSLVPCVQFSYPRRDLPRRGAGNFIPGSRQSWFRTNGARPRQKIRGLRLTHNAGEAPRLHSKGEKMAGMSASRGLPANPTVEGIAPVSNPAFRPLFKSQRLTPTPVQAPAPGSPRISSVSAAE